LVVVVIDLLLERNQSNGEANAACAEIRGARGSLLARQRPRETKC